MEQAEQAKKLALLRYRTALAAIDGSTVKMVLTNLLAEPFKHPELVEQDEDGTTLFLEYKKGDEVAVSPDTAEHLFMTGQAEPVEE